MVPSPRITVFHAPNNPMHHPDAPVNTFFDPQSRPTRTGPPPGWPVDHPRSLPRAGGEVLAAQAHDGGAWPMPTGRR